VNFRNFCKEEKKCRVPKVKRIFLFYFIFILFGKNGSKSPHYEEKKILKLPYLASNNSLNYRKVFYFPLSPLAKFG